MSSEPVSAVVDRVGSASGLPTGEKPAATYPHVIVYGDDDPGLFGRVGGGPSSRESEVVTVTVGTSPLQCRLAAVRVRDALEGWHPVVDGRASHRIRRGMAGPMISDDSLPDKVLYSMTAYWYVRTNL